MFEFLKKKKVKTLNDTVDPEYIACIKQAMEVQAARELYKRGEINLNVVRELTN